MKNYYSKIFKKSKIRRKATLSALDLGEKFSFSALNNTRILSRLSEYSAWKTRSEDDRDLSSLEDAIVKDFIALVNQNIVLSQKVGESNDLHAQCQERIVGLEEQVRIFSREKANVMEEYRVLDSNYKFLSLKNEQLSNYCANLQEQLGVLSNGLDIKEFRKSNELEFICNKLQKNLEDLEKEYSALKSFVDEKEYWPSTNKPNKLSTQIFSLRDLPKNNLPSDNIQPFKVPKVEDDIYIPKAPFGKDSDSLERSDASAQTDMGFDVLKLEQAYARLKKKNKQLTKILDQFQTKKDIHTSNNEENETVNQMSELTSEISVLQLKPYTVARKEVEVLKEIRTSEIKSSSETNISFSQIELKNLDRNLITLHQEIQNRDQELIILRNEYQTLEGNMKREIIVRDQNIASLKNEYHAMEGALKKEFESRESVVVKVQDEYRMMEKALKKEIETRKEDLGSLQNDYSTMEQALKKEIEHRDQDLAKVRSECQELFQICNESKAKNDDMMKQLEKVNIEVSYATEKEALENRLDDSLKEISRLKDEKNWVLNSTQEYEKLQKDHSESIKLIETLKAEKISYQELQARHAAEYDVLLSKKKNLTEEVAKYTQSLLEVRQEYGEISELYDQSIAEKDDMSREVSKLRNGLELAQNQIIALSEEKSKLEISLNESKLLIQQNQDLIPSDDFLRLKNENHENITLLVAQRKEIDSYKEKLANHDIEYSELLAKNESLNDQIKNTDHHMAILRQEYQELSNAQDQMNLENVELSESLNKLQFKIDSVKEKNKCLCAEKADLENLLSSAQKDLSSLKKQNEDLTEKLLCEQYECKYKIGALQDEITKYRSSIEHHKAEYDEFAAKKESLLNEVGILHQEIASRDHLVSDLHNDKNKLQIDVEVLRARITSVQEDHQILTEELDLSKSQLMKLSKELEEALHFSSKKDQRIKETFSEFVRITNQLKYEQAQRIEMEKKLRSDLKNALDERNSLLHKGPSEEVMNLQNELKSCEEKLFSLGIKYGQLEAEMEKKELEYREDINEADANLEKLLQKYDDLSKKAMLLETLYKDAQTKFAKTRHVIR